MSTALVALTDLVKAWKPKNLPNGRGANTVEPQVADLYSSLVMLPTSGGYEHSYATYLYQLVGGHILAAGVRFSVRVGVETQNPLDRLDRAHQAMAGYLNDVMAAAKRGEVPPPAPQGVAIIEDDEAFPVPYDFPEESAAA